MSIHLNDKEEPQAQRFGEGIFLVKDSEVGRRLCEPGGNQSAHLKPCPKDIIVQGEGSGFCDEYKRPWGLFLSTEKTIPAVTGKPDHV